MLDALAPYAAACDPRADYHAWRGALLLTSGQTEAAALALEKALMLDPELPGAQIDYAQALAQLGQAQAARALVDDVVQRSDLPAALHAWLSRHWGGSGHPWQLGGQLQLDLGRESNLNSATSAESLDLLLAGQVITLPLDDSERPRPGTATRLRLQTWGHYRQGEREWRVVGGLAVRHAPQFGSSDLQQLEGGLEHLWLGEASQSSLALAAQHLTLDETPIYSETAVQWAIQRRFAEQPCQNRLALGHAQQRYPASPSLDGAYTHTRIDIECQHGQRALTRLGLAMGRDRPEAERPGGVKLRYDLQWRHLRELAGGRMELWWNGRHSSDADSYSPLLGETRAKNRRNDIGVSYWYPVGPYTRIGAELEITSQKSTISLYQMNNKTLYAGLRWYF